jgi:osmotically-inducible protein OsmY
MGKSVKLSEYFDKPQGIGVPATTDAAGQIVTHHNQEISCDEQHTGAIITKVRERLRRHSHLRVQRIWCEIDDGRLFLRGQVPSFFYKQLAQEAVQTIAGVGQILNEIEVVW